MAPDHRKTDPDDSGAWETRAVYNIPKSWRKWVTLFGILASILVTIYTAIPKGSEKDDETGQREIMAKLTRINSSVESLVSARDADQPDAEELRKSVAAIRALCDKISTGVRRNAEELKAITEKLSEIQAKMEDWERKGLKRK